MTTGNGPPRSGWVMKVVVLPSLVAISTWLSIMAVPLSLVDSDFSFVRKVRLQGTGAMTRRGARRAGLELAAPYRHFPDGAIGDQSGAFFDDPDHQPVFRRDRPPDE